MNEASAECSVFVCQLKRAICPTPGCLLGPSAYYFICSFLTCSLAGLFGRARIGALHRGLGHRGQDDNFFPHPMPNGV